MDRRMDGWTDGQTDGWKHGRTGGRGCARTRRRCRARVRASLARGSPRPRIPLAGGGWGGVSRRRPPRCHWPRAPLCAGRARPPPVAGASGGHKGRSMVLVHVGYLVLPVFGSVRNRGTAPGNAGSRPGAAGGGEGGRRVPGPRRQEGGAAPQRSPQRTSPSPAASPSLGRLPPHTRHASGPPSRPHLPTAVDLFHPPLLPFFFYGFYFIF